jgi:hypothetical protein
MVVTINTSQCDVHIQIGSGNVPTLIALTRLSRCAKFDLCYIAHSGSDASNVESLRIEGIVPLCWLRVLVSGLAVVSQRTFRRRSLYDLHTFAAVVKADESSAWCEASTPLAGGSMQTHQPEEMDLIYDLLWF